MLLSHNEIMLKFVKVEQQILKIDRRTELNEKDIMDIFDALNQLITKEESPKTARKKIGYK
jgi:septation ring formation regulator EzrA